MKQAKKFLTLILTISILASSFLVNVFAINNYNKDSTLTSAEFKHTTNEISLFSTSSSISVKHNNTIDEIVAKEKEFAHNGFIYSKQPSYETVPKLTAPYEAGSLKEQSLDDALNSLKMVRYLAGIPYNDIIIDEDETITAQHKSVLMAVAGYGHHPSQPNDMSNEFFEIANSYTSECIAGASWEAPLSSRVLSWIADGGENNIERAGHRMILFNPGATKFGFGYAHNSKERYENLYTVHVQYTFDETNSYVAWPNSGAFPIQYFLESSDLYSEPPYPWSISLGEPYLIPSKDEIVIKLTRNRDNKIWTFDKTTPRLGIGNLPDNSMHLSVNGKNIIFRPDVTSLGTIRDGDIFTVELSGIKYTNGTSATLKYDINFFDLSKEMNRSRINIIVKHNDEPIEHAEVEIDGQTLMTDSNGLASLRVANNKKYDYTVLKSGYNTETGTISVVNSEVTTTIEATIPVFFEISETSKSYNGIGQGVVVNSSPEIEYIVTYNGSTDIPIAAGKYDVVVKANQQGYSGHQTATLTISKADITVTANNIQKREGTDDPLLTYEYDGTLYGKDKFTGELTRQSGEAIGTYDILQGTLSLSDNYNIIYNRAVFEIVEKTPQNITVSDITEKTYGDSSFVVTATPDAISQLEEFTFESSNTDVAEIATDGTVTIKAAGETNITVKQAGDNEYAAFEKTQKLTIAQKEVTVSDINLDEKTAVLTGVLEAEPGAVEADFSKVALEIIPEEKEEPSEGEEPVVSTTATAKVTGLALKGDKSANYKLADSEIEATVSLENVVTIEINTENGTVTGNGTYLINTDITVAATSDKDYNFDGWYIVDEKITTDAEYTFTTNESITLTAKFTKKPTQTTGGGGGSSGGSSGGGFSAGGDKSNTGANKLGNKDEKDITVPEETPEEAPIATPSISVVSFTDLGNYAWAEDAITNLVENGIIRGTSSTTYSPAANIIRADFVALVVRMFNLSSAETENFTDVTTSDYFAAELAIAKNNGIVGGIGDNKFAPRGNITRQDMMVMLYRAMQKLGIELSGTQSTDVSDMDTVSEYAKEAVETLMANGIINGKNGKIDPKANATRAEVAVMLNRVLDLIK